MNKPTKPKSKRVQYEEEIKRLKDALRITYGHDVYEFGCPECKRGAPHLNGCFIASVIYHPA